MFTGRLPAMFKPRVLTALLAFLVVTLAASGCPGEARPPGVLEGTVTIGPLTPVEVPGEKPPVPPEVYAARKIMIYDEHGMKFITSASIRNDGTYRMELPPGWYTVDINRIGIDSSPDVPAQVEIVSGQTLRLDIDIDTGIR
jgi:hypothetical protein